MRRSELFRNQRSPASVGCVWGDAEMTNQVLVDPTLSVKLHLASPMVAGVSVARSGGECGEMPSLQLSIRPACVRGTWELPCQHRSSNGRERVALIANNQDLLNTNTATSTQPSCRIKESGLMARMITTLPRFVPLSAPSSWRQPKILPGSQSRNRPAATQLRAIMHGYSILLQHRRGMTPPKVRHQKPGPEKTISGLRRVLGALRSGATYVRKIPAATCATSFKHLRSICPHSDPAPRLYWDRMTNWFWNN